MIGFTQVQLHGLVDYPDEDSDEDGENVIDDANKTDDQPPAKKVRVSL
jgi:hypothetical protein